VNGNYTQQQGQLVPLHAARYCHQHFPGLASCPVQLLQLGVDQVTGVSGGAQRGLQGLGAQLPPEAGIDVTGLQPGGGPGRAAEAVLSARQQGVAGTLQVGAIVP
jgi:hypothetical protein